MGIEIIDWSKVYLVHNQRSDFAGNVGNRVVIFADTAGAQPASPAAVLSDPKLVQTALNCVRTEPRLQAFGDVWIDPRKLCHTRPGSSALLSFALSGGRISTVQVPSEVLQSIKAKGLEIAEVRAVPSRSPARRRNQELVADRA